MAHLDEVKLFWVRQKAPRFSRLSVNVVREVCEYLCLCDPLVAVLESKVLRVDAKLRRVELLFPLDEGLGVSSGTSFLLISPKCVFVCGFDKIDRGGRARQKREKRIFLRRGEQGAWRECT